MRRALSVPLPGRRALLTIGGLLIFLLAVWLGARVLAPVVAVPMEDALAGSSLHQVHTVDGAVYLGRVSSIGAEALLLREPAVLRPADTDEGDPQFVVQALFADPYNIIGPVAIQRPQIVAVGSVAEGSGLADAYQQAWAGRTPRESIPAPS